MDVQEPARKVEIGIGVARRELERRARTHIESRGDLDLVAVVVAAAQHIDRAEIGRAFEV